MKTGPKPRPLAERLWPRVDKTAAAPCWLWTGPATRAGYGRIGTGARGKTIGTHRAVYELLVGPIAAGMTLDHLCKNPRCCNPSHLEPVTMRENLLRGDGFPAKNAKKTHCPRGHAYDLRYRKSGARACSTCQRARQAAHYREKRRLLCG